MEDVGNVKVGTPQTTPTAPSHVRGVHEGNWPSEGRRMEGHRASADRSTGVNARARKPIDPRSPNLTPA